MKQYNIPKTTVEELQIDTDFLKTSDFSTPEEKGDGVWHVREEELETDFFKSDFNE